MYGDAVPFRLWDQYRHGGHARGWRPEGLPYTPESDHIQPMSGSASRLATRCDETVSGLVL